MFQLCLHRPGISLCSCSILASKAEIGPKLATHEGLVMHYMSMLFLYWLSDLQRLEFLCSFRAFSRTSVYHCARTHAALQINLYGQVLTLRKLAIRLHSQTCAFNMTFDSSSRIPKNHYILSSTRVRNSMRKLQLFGVPAQRSAHDLGPFPAS